MDWVQKQAREKELAKHKKNKGSENMPNKDGTGPNRLTGCNNQKIRCCQEPNQNRFRGNGCRRFIQEQNLNEEDEKTILQIQLKNIESQKELIQKRVEELNKKE